MTILIIEDNPLFAELIQYQLDEHRVFHVETLKAAREWLEANKADLLLVDLGLPDSRGLSTLDALSDVKISKIVLTASLGLTDETAKRGAIDYIEKGRIEDIVARIRFNINKLVVKRFRIDAGVFEQLKSCLMAPRLKGHELTPV